MATANKVHFGLKNVHYALITYSSAGVPSWGNPQAVPGAVSLSLSRSGSDTDFYADDMKYFHLSGNSGYEGTLEMADFPVKMREDLWNETLTSTSKVLIEYVSAQPAEFALMFEIDGDQTPERYCLYRCQASRPDLASETKGESTEVHTQSCDLTVMPVLYPGNLLNGLVKYRTTADTPSATYTSFYSSVLTTLT